MSAGASTAAPDYSTAALNTYYEQHILPMCEKFERQRVQAAAQASRRQWIALPLAVAFCYFTLRVFQALGFWPGLFTGGVLLLSLALWVAMPGIVFRNNIRRNVWPVVFAFFGPDFRFLRGTGSSASERVLRGTGMLDARGRWEFGDRVTGSYRECRISFEELTVWSETRQEEKKQSRRLFQGVVISLHLRLPLRARTLVLREIGTFGNRTWQPGDAFRRVRLEDPEFERAFEVFGEDQVDARVALTPAMMERIARLDRQHGGKLQCCFHPAGFHAFIATQRDYFEVHAGLDNVVNLRKDVLGLRTEMQIVFSLVDQLKLHEPGRI